MEIQLGGAEGAVRQGIADHTVSGQVRGKTRNRQQHEENSTERFHSCWRLQQSNISAKCFVCGIIPNFLKNVFGKT